MVAAAAGMGVAWVQVAEGEMDLCTAPMVVAAARAAEATVVAKAAVATVVEALVREGAVGSAPAFSEEALAVATAPGPAGASSTERRRPRGAAQLHPALKRLRRGAFALPASHGVSLAMAI